MAISDKRILPTVLVLVFLFLLLVVLRATALTQTDIVYPSDDTYVNSSSSATNYDGTIPVAGAENSDLLETWYRLDLSDPTGYYVTSAILWTYVSAARNAEDYNIHQASDSTWTETDLTWDTKSSYGGTLDTNSISASGWQIWTVTGSYAEAFSNGSSYTSYAIENGVEGDVRVEDLENTGGSGNLPYINLTMMIPEVYRLSPADSLSTYNTTLVFSYNTTDAGNITNCSLILDSLVNKTNTSITENATSNFTVTGIDTGDHTWAVRCYDVNREVYEINPGTRDLTILAKVDWYNPSSSTDLDIGYALIGAAAPSGSREIYSNNSNGNVAVSCASGDCAVFDNNWTTQDMAGGQILAVKFNCTTPVAGSYTADFELTSDDDVSADTLSVNCSVLAPDLRINSTNITFSDSTPVEGDTVTISAGIYNDGTWTATDAAIQFYEGHYLTGTQIGSDQQVTLAPGEMTTVQQEWTAGIGQFEIYVVVDPDVDTNGSIAEGNESNNVAFNTIDTQMWTTFIGNVTGFLVLQTVDNSTVLKWNVTDTTDSLIYVVDTDSSISFDSLTALSRDTEGGYHVDDFLELDSALNTTSFNDSINLTYTVSGNPLSTETFKTFGQSVTDVPTINSTNTVSFVTGILWDSSDDAGNGEFDNTTKEDIVFTSRVNVSKTGMHGTYDYEIRVPSRLKRYKGSDYNTVTFYTEIK